MLIKAIIQQNLNNCLTQTDFKHLGKLSRGKVRDIYDLGDKLVIIATDRQSAFDRILAAVPFKGQVLNQISEFWAKNSRDIIDNHLIEVPDPNVMIVKKCQIFPVEVVVRGYITGVTDTSLWVNYQKGERNFCGNLIPEGLKKNQKLPYPIITPTTKSENHDEKISPQEILEKNLIGEKNWSLIQKTAFHLFERGTEIGERNGLILVDTKYEFGLDDHGQILLADEIHTPDSSRFWLKETYEEKFKKGEEPESIDKEFLRLWFVKNSDPYHDRELPAAPPELITELASRYILLYEKITGGKFEIGTTLPIKERIEKNLEKYFIN